ncbi:MAG TPA: ABC transporter permease [Acidimicrobiales bacterium]|nr:ABC transporter permease [Acidimicrobiales bacterium]
MSQVRAAGLIAAVDLRRRFRNRSFLIQAIGGPLALATIIGLAFGSGDEIDATVGLVDADGSPMAAQFVEGVAGADTGGGLRFERLDTAAEARAEVDDGDIGAAVIVPAGFGDSVATDAPGELEVITDPADDPIAAEVARSVAGGFTARVNAARLAGATVAAEGGDLPPPDELAAIELPVEIAQTGSGGDVSPGTYFGPTMALLFLFLMVGTLARDLLTEQRLSVLDRVRAAPVRDATVLAGKAASVVVIAAVTFAVIWLVTGVALGADWGDPAGVVLLIVAVSLAIAGLSGFVAAIAKTEASADMLATFTAFVFALIGGNFIPLGDLPEALRRLSLATPNGWAVQGFAELSVGGGAAADVIPHVAALLGFAAASAAVAAVLLPRRLGARR